MSKAKPAKKPTTKVGRECVRGMKQLRDALALTKPIHDRAIAAAVRKEREPKKQGGGWEIKPVGNTQNGEGQ